MAHKGLCLHLEQSSERMLLYRAYAAAIFFGAIPTYRVLPYSMIMMTSNEHFERTLSQRLVAI